jgi:NTP pyrophosphatase (non-canonical NTP hydrolase)
MTTLERAIETYGEDMQLNVAIEELSELIKEICKHKRGRENRDAIIEEMADVNIMFSQLQIIFNIRTGEIASKVIEKMERLEKRLAEQETMSKAEDEAIEGLKLDLSVGAFAGGLSRYEGSENE